ncbi:MULTISPECIES: hypothetical protein [Streptomyces]|uniref:hypothetical protein n=1 Tax=Streptomyces TaxID=1883 RepID=UPI0016001FD5|nr:hypothetical protein [Streptomyces murinus]MBA9050810.1 hypothetical protein [Streptomyces murinus]
MAKVIIDSVKIELTQAEMSLILRSLKYYHANEWNDDVKIASLITDLEGGK